MLSLTNHDSEGLEMGLTPQERQQQNDMQKDIKDMLARMSVVETQVTALFSDKNRFIGTCITLFILAVAGVAGYIWAKITGH